MSEIVQTKLSRVTVFEDRADVIRDAEISLEPGSRVLVVPDLPAVLSDEHVVARLEPLEGSAPAHVNDVRVVRLILRGDDQVSARSAELHRQIEALDDELRAAEAIAQRANHERAGSEIALRRWLEQASRAAGVGEGDPESWSRGLEIFSQQLVDADARRAAARAAVAAARRQRERTLAAAPGKKPLGQRLVAQLELRVSGPGGRYRLVVSTLVPCAAWRPSHEAVLVRNGAAEVQPRVRFITSATVWNRTGEAWNDVELVLSTARPSAGAELPPLSADRLTLRQKTAEERRTIVVEHREEGVPKAAPQGTAPGVDDGGEARVFRAPRARIPDDGRPHLVEVARFETPANVERVAVPELATHVFLRASIQNAGAAPILAGPVTLVVDGAWVGTGDVLYIGMGERFDLSFGSDDRFVVRTQTRRLEDKKLVGRDVVHFLRETTLSQTGTGRERVTVQLRLPVSEVKQLKVLPSPQHSTIDLGGKSAPDEHGIVRVPVELAPGEEKKLVLAFSFDADGDVQIPDPW